MFGILIGKQYGNSIISPKKTKENRRKWKKQTDGDFVEYKNNYKQSQVISEIKKELDPTSGTAAQVNSPYDTFINTEIQLQYNEIVQINKKRTTGPDGKVTENYNNNLLLNSMIYEIEFLDGQIKKYITNIRVENILL